ncbi:hypothetical protein SEA_MILDRED21_72 [Streptomyces phage Mildred21]|uniref:Uncharacterized protein n=1 Tax=Streptomyces phage Mildred21 TaxID=2023959 RepID=A0A222YWC0_9CAUD|nr:hypothetical protein FDI35_gp199 [Streptomyces phage Mildred21]ASR75479.1 hypothetical protein SEA_MILDRED21_72 [Streptomyces phage Mildred21]
MSQTVSAEIGYTKNLGNFQSVKVSVGLQDYVRNGETFDEAYARIFKKIEDKLAEKVAEAVEALGG